MIEQHFHGEEEEGEEKLIVGKKDLLADLPGREITAENERTEELERLRGEILAEGASKQDNDRELVRAIRMPKRTNAEPVPLKPEEERLVERTVEETKDGLARTYEPGFGIFPSADKETNFHGQVYARDSAHAAGNYFAEANPDAMRDFLGTLLKHQREDGALPLRVEKEYQIIKLVPGLGGLARPLFELMNEKLLGRKERAVYEGYDFGASGSEDTIPAVLIAAGEFFIASDEGRAFAEEHFDGLRKAVGFFKAKTDDEDGLAVITRNNPDWADSLKRTGKLGGINVWWARGLRMMEFMANQLGHEEDAKKYKEEFRKVKEGVLEKLYNAEEGYFRTKEGEDRVDTVASIFGALYLLNPEEAVKVEETLERRVRHPSGLTNFDPPYPRAEIFGMHKLWGALAGIQGKWGMHEYHNKLVWPWVTCENIQVKIKIALQHKDEVVREKYKQEAVRDLLALSEIFEQAGGPCEVLDPEKPERADISLYDPPKQFMGTMSAYQGAYQQVKNLGWLA